jgi:PhnB protein
MARKSVAKKKKVSTKKKLILKKPKKKAAKKVAAIRRKKKVLAVPKGYHSITPYLIINDATAAIAFYKKVFGAKEVVRMEHSNGKVGHAELKIGDAKIMLADECSDMDTRSPQAYGGSAVIVHLYIKDVDTIVKRAISAGAKLVKPVEDMFYGDRSGMVEDPHGHTWCVSTHIEDVSPAKVKKRAMVLFGK